MNFADVLSDCLAINFLCWGVAFEKTSDFFNAPFYQEETRVHPNLRKPIILCFAVAAWHVGNVLLLKFHRTGFGIAG